MIAQNNGYEKSIEAYGGFGLNELSKYQLGISMYNGYRFHDYCYLGLGIGFRYQEARYMLSRSTYGITTDSREPRFIIPICARIKINLTNTPTSPFLMADIGTNIDVGYVKYKNITGFFFEPLFGVDINTQKSTVPYFAIGVNIASAKYKYFNIPSVYSGEVYSKATTFVFHVGFKF
jgi:hypothetical protein